MAVSNRSFSFGVLGLAFMLGFGVMIYSWQIPQETKELDSGLEGGDKAPLVKVYELLKDVILDKDVYAPNETIVAKAVIVNDGSSPVRIRPPSALSATGYSPGITDERVSQSVSITWAESEIEILANSSMVLPSFHFRGQKPGPFIISISGFPEKEVMIVDPDAEPSISLTVSVKLNRDVFSVNDKAQLIFTNRGSKEATYGSQYDIERLEDDEWVEVSPFPSPYAWPAVAIILPPRGTTRQEIKIDTLEPGHYRVHKKVDIGVGEAKFTLEFDIVDEG